MKKIVTSALPGAIRSGNHDLLDCARSCVRAASLLVLLAFCLSTHAATQTFPGTIKREVWTGAASRVAVYDGSLGAPNIVTYETKFEAPFNWGANYSMRLSGWFIPATTGNYYFIVSSDDDGDLWLSTDANPANKRLIAQQPGWNSHLNWPGDDGGATPEPQKNSQTYSAPDGTKPFAAGIALTAGTPYYIEGVMHEGGGGDNLEVTAQLVGTPIPDSGEDVAIPAEQIALLYIVPTSLSATITPGNTTASAGTAVSFTANVTTDTDDAVTYQWRVNGVDVVGATGKNFTTQILGTGNTGQTVDVVVGLEHFPNTATSAQSTITVPATGEQVVPNHLKLEFFPGATRTGIESGNVGAPAWTRNLTSFETPLNFGSNYGLRVSGYFTPATSGNYHFAVSSDDDSDVFLSTDASPASKRLIMQQPGWNANREWTTDAGGGAMNPQRFSNTWVPDPANPPATPPFADGIALTGGQKYYIEGVLTEGGGGDNFTVVFYPAVGGTPPVDGDPSNLTGALISYATSPATTLTITDQPDDVTVTETFPAMFTVVAQTDSAVEPTYQWRRNGVNIPGANSPSFSLTGAAADNGAKYSVVVAVPGTSLTVTSADATLTVRSPVLASGFLKREFFQGGTRAEVYAGTAGTPVVTALSSFEAPINVGADYAQRISGFFIPATTDDYVFFLSADDSADLFLSTDADPANKHLIALEASWSNSRQWNTPGGGASSAEAKRSDSFAGTEWPDGMGGVQNTITLTAGQRYYIEGVMQEGGGGDNLSVTVVTAADAAAGIPANGAATTLTGERIGFLVPPANVTITQPPANIAVTENRTATFTVTATTDSMFGSLSYQWQRNGVDIAGATSASYTTPRLALANSGDTYRVVVNAPGATAVTSQAATVTVNPDTVAPAIVSAGSVKRGTGFEIGVGFDEAIDPVTAAATANYTLSKGSVTAVRYEPYATPIDPNAPSAVQGAVVLVTSGLAVGDNVTVTVKNVTDAKGNAIPAAGVSKIVAITGKMTWVAVGASEYIDGITPADWGQTAANYYDDAVALETDKDFDLISGGTANWDAYDEATFVYEELTGDFDRIVRVEYQDPSSQWARAGIMARTTLDEGVTRAAATTPAAEGGTPMGAAMIVRVNPTVQWNGAAGNNGYEWVFRDLVGGNYSSSGGGGVPLYPNAWMRLQRTGQLFTGFRSVDGETWVNIGTHDWSAIVDGDGNPAPMPDKLFVGPYFAPELNNNEAWRIGHSVVAKFREYGPFGTVVEEIELTATMAGNQITITWTGGGTLEHTAALTPGATWTSTGDSDGSFSETIAATGNRFYRVRK